MITALLSIIIIIIILVIASGFYSYFNSSKAFATKDYSDNAAISLVDKNNKILNRNFGQDSNQNFSSGVTTGSYPVGITVNPYTNKIYVANQYSNTVSVFDDSTDKLVNTINTGIFPYSIDSNLFNNRIYVTNRGSNEVTVIDSSTDLVIDKIPVGRSPIQVKVDPSNNWVYVANIDSNSISIIDSITNKVIKTIKGINSPYGISINPISDRVYVSNIASSTVTVLDRKINNNFTILKNIKVGMAPSSMDIDIQRNLIFVSNFLSDSVSIINGTNDSFIKNVDVGKSPVGVKSNPFSGKVYVSNTASNAVSIINETNLKRIKNIQVNPSSIVDKKDYPYAIPANVTFPLIASFIGIDPLSNLIYVTNTASNTLSVINGSQDDDIVRINFDSQPDDSGFIECNHVRNLKQNMTTTFVIDKINSCMAIPERGYAFDSWSGMLVSNKNPLEFTANAYGNIVANFKQAISTEQYILLIGGIMGIFSVLIGWYFKGSQRRKFNKLIQIINKAIEDSDVGNKQESIIKLENLRKDIFNTYRRGSLTDFQFDFLDKTLLNYITKIGNL